MAALTNFRMAVGKKIYKCQIRLQLSYKLPNRAADHHSYQHLIFFRQSQACDLRRLDFMPGVTSVVFMVMCMVKIIRIYSQYSCGLLFNTITRYSKKNKASKLTIQQSTLHPGCWGTLAPPSLIPTKYENITG